MAIALANSSGSAAFEIAANMKTNPKTILMVIRKYLLLKISYIFNLTQMDVQQDNLHSNHSIQPPKKI